MTHHDTHPIGAPCWAELSSSDPAGAASFYRGLFGWAAEHDGETKEGSLTFTQDGHPIAGCGPNSPDSGFPDRWGIYLATDDAAVTATTATRHGGHVVVGATQVGELGTMAIVLDPGDAVVGAWQPDRHHGFGVIGEPATPTWFELHTRDYDAVVAFYRDVFAWDIHVRSDVPEFRYTTFGTDPEARAGIMDASAFLAEGVPSTWQVYFDVADVDAALARVTDLGGTVVDQPDDTPFGRLATAADPTGATFKLVART